MSELPAQHTPEDIAHEAAYLRQWMFEKSAEMLTQLAAAIRLATTGLGASHG
jgi:hypothetical protein